MKLGSLEFTAEEFKSLEISSHGAENCARIANAILLAKLENAPEVFGIEHLHDHIWKLGCCVDRRGGDVVKSAARLVMIEPIVDEQKDMRDEDK